MDLGAQRPNVGDTRERILEAACTCVGRVGLAKTTLDDVARVAECSRATVYRYFDSKDVLVREAVAGELRALRVDLAFAAGDAPNLPDALTAFVVTLARRFEAHDALQFVLQNEAGVVLPYLAFDGCDTLLRAGSELVTTTLGDHIESSDAPRFGEWVTRILLSYLLSPPEGVRLSDERSARALVEKFLVPALSPAKSVRVVSEVM